MVLGSRALYWAVGPRCWAVGPSLGKLDPGLGQQCSRGVVSMVLVFYLCNLIMLRLQLPIQPKLPWFVHVVKCKGVLVGGFYVFVAVGFCFKAWRKLCAEPH